MNKGRCLVAVLVRRLVKRGIRDTLLAAEWNMQNLKFGLASRHGTRNLEAPPETNRRWGVETPTKRNSVTACCGRVACAYVQPATVKAHAPDLWQVSNIRLCGRRPERT